MRNGQRTAFWLDWWIGDEPLCKSFPRLFAVCSDPQIHVAEVFAPNSEGISFRRVLDQEGLAQWHGLVALSDSVVLSEGHDEIR